MMGLFEYDIDVDDVLSFAHPSTLARIDREVNRAVEQELTQAVVRAQATAEFQDRTGAFRASITFEVGGTVSGGDLSVRLFSPVDYGGYLEDGTPPHDIHPVTRKMLRWTKNGNVYFARKVHHPGTRPRRILASAVDFVQLEIKIGEAVVRAMRR